MNDALVRDYSREYYRIFKQIFQLICTKTFKINVAETTFLINCVSWAMVF